MANLLKFKELNLIFRYFSVIETKSKNQPFSLFFIWNKFVLNPPCDSTLKSRLLIKMTQFVFILCYYAWRELDGLRDNLSMIK